MTDLGVRMVWSTKLAKQKRLKLFSWAEKREGRTPAVFRKEEGESAKEDVEEGERSLLLHFVRSSACPPSPLLFSMPFLPFRVDAVPLFLLLLFLRCCPVVCQTREGMLHTRLLPASFTTRRSTSVFSW